jgi:hypothetical protein
MPPSFCRIFLRALALISLALTVIAEPMRPTLDPPRLPAPPPLTLHAGYIFSGTVKAVRRLTPRARRVGTVQITFHVDKAIRGVRAGQTLTVREWAGLWESGERYHAGERVLLFLYPTSKLGLTSPVGGPAGRFKIDGDGRVILDPGSFDPRRVGTPPPIPTTAQESLEKTRVSMQEFLRNLRLVGEE